VFYSVIETRDFSLFNQSAQALLKGYFINIYIVVLKFTQMASLNPPNVLNNFANPLPPQ
jgi:hypothetical protein